MNIDSTNMRPRDWLKIRDVIVEAYDRYDGFVVLHGTDTMAYTAAALSYLIQDSEKPIVLTGSQQPMASPFTDAKLNLYQSVLYAADDGSRDVNVVFSGKVIAGTRAHKQRTMSFNAFSSMNYPSLAYIRNNRIVRAGEAAGVAAPGGRLPRVWRHTARARHRSEAHARAAAQHLRLTRSSDYDAPSLETFGIGGIPSYGDGSRGRHPDWVGSGRTLVDHACPEEGLDWASTRSAAPMRTTPASSRETT